MPNPNITNIVQYFAGCSNPEAERAARSICRDPEAVDFLVKAAMKCGVSTSGVGLGWMVMSSGLSPVSAPMLGLGAGISAASAIKAKQYCTDMVARWHEAGPSDARRLLLE